MRIHTFIRTIVIAGIMATTAYAQAAPNLKKLLAGVEIVPATAQGQIIGIQIKDRLDDSWWAQAGLQRGDIIVADGKVSWANPEAAAAQLGQLASGHIYTLKILRGSQPVTLSVAFSP